MINETMVPSNLLNERTPFGRKRGRYQTKWFRGTDGGKRGEPTSLYWVVMGDSPRVIKRVVKSEG